MANTERELEPVRQSVQVDCAPDEAFRLFTERIGEWWPLSSYSTGGEDAAETCVIEPWPGGRVYERSRTGEEHDWGSVVDWDPPRHLRLRWDPAGTGDSREAVAVEFEVERDGTRVTLTHSDWQAAGVAVCAAESFGANVQSLLLARFAELVEQELVMA
jgi:uncharacterized protein YndB with AHSA1/START domain